MLGCARGWHDQRPDSKHAPSASPVSIEAAVLSNRDEPVTTRLLQVQEDWDDIGSASSAAKSGRRVLKAFCCWYLTRDALPS
jgi:hypothetical protein